MVRGLQGPVPAAQRQYCYPLTTTDAYSRWLLTCEGLDDTKAAGAWRSPGLLDDRRSDLIQVPSPLLACALKLRPQRLVDEPLWHSLDDGGAPLPIARCTRKTLSIES
jgi:hypothetical protein